jgi:hypothetical protein
MNGDSRDSLPNCPSRPPRWTNSLRGWLSLGEEGHQVKASTISSHAHSRTTYVRAHTYAHSYIHTYTYARTHIHTHKYTTHGHTYVHNRIHTYARIQCTHKRMRTHTHVCARKYTHVRACTNTHTHTCTHTHAHVRARTRACTCSSEGQRPSRSSHWGN